MSAEDVEKPVPPPELPDDFEGKKLSPDEQQRIKDTIKYLELQWYTQEEKRLMEVVIRAKTASMRKPDNVEFKITAYIAEMNLDSHRRTRSVMVAQARYAYEENHLRFLSSISQKRSEPQSSSIQGPKVPDAESAQNEKRLTPEEVQTILASQRAAQANADEKSQ